MCALAFSALGSAHSPKAHCAPHTALRCCTEHRSRQVYEEPPPVEEEEEEAETAAVMAGESIGEKRRNRMRPTTIEFLTSDKPAESSGRLLPVVLKPTQPGKCGRPLHRAMYGPQVCKSAVVLSR